MTQHEFRMPVSEAEARSLRVGDMVVLQGSGYGIRDATQIALFDRGRAAVWTRFVTVMH